ncbi:MAG: hypothetical protein WCK49_09505, partial [Myxococcaceae bacterium]
MLRIFLCLSVIIQTVVAYAAPLGTALELYNTYRDDLRYDEVTYLTAHNAFTIHTEGWNIYQQSLNFDQQFEYGVWSFMIDLHWCKDGDSEPLYVALAHEFRASKNRYNYTEPRNHVHLSSCDRSSAQRTRPGHRSFESFLKEYVKKWLEKDANAIITLHLESYLGIDGAAQLRTLFSRAGVLDYIYRNHSQNSWPTLGEMRKTGKRLVLFSSNSGDSVLDDVFSTIHYRETAYDLTSSPNCERRFDERDYSNTTSLLLINHFYSIAFEASTLTYHQINNPYATSMLDKYSNVVSPELWKRTDQCFQQEKIYPTFIAVDFIEEGDAGGTREWVLYLNHLRRLHASNPSADPFSKKFLRRASNNHTKPMLENSYVRSVFDWMMVCEPAISPLLAFGSYRYPWMSKAAAMTAIPTVFSMTEKLVGHYVPAAFASYFGAL